MRRILGRDLQLSGVLRLSTEGADQVIRDLRAASRACAR